MSAARPTAVTHQREPKVCMLVRSFPCRRSRCSGCATFRVAAGYLLHTTSRRSGRPIGETKGFCEGDRTPPSETFVHFRPALERATPTAKRGPKTAQSDLAVVALIRALLATSPFHSEGHRKVSVRLRQHGVHVGKARVLRLMRVHGLLAPTRPAMCMAIPLTRGASRPTGPTSSGHGCNLLLDRGRRLVLVLRGDRARDRRARGLEATKRDDRWAALEPPLTAIQPVRRSGHRYCSDPGLRR